MNVVTRMASLATTSSTSSMPPSNSKSTSNFEMIDCSETSADQSDTIKQMFNRIDDETKLSDETSTNELTITSLTKQLSNSLTSSVSKLPTLAEINSIASSDSKTDILNKFHLKTLNEISDNFQNKNPSIRAINNKSILLGKEEDEEEEEKKVKSESFLLLENITTDQNEITASKLPSLSTTLNEAKPRHFLHELVWAKVNGQPWWPCKITCENEHERGSFYKLTSGKIKFINYILLFFCCCLSLYRKNITYIFCCYVLLFCYSRKQTNVFYSVLWHSI